MVLAASATGCIVPYATPPMRAEVGAATPITARDDDAGDPMAAAAAASPALHVAAGVSLASAAKDRPPRFDLGVGYLMETSGTNATSHGAYVDAAVFVVGHGRSGGRASVGMRVELRATPEGAVGAVKARFDVEVYVGGSGKFSGSDRCGSTASTYHGTSAIGLYAEGGPALAPNGTAFVASTGVSIRLPSVLGVYVGIPWCR